MEKRARFECRSSLAASGVRYCSLAGDLSAVGDLPDVGEEKRSLRGRCMCIRLIFGLERHDMNQRGGLCSVG